MHAPNHRWYELRAVAMDALSSTGTSIGSCDDGLRSDVPPHEFIASGAFGRQPLEDMLAAIIAQ